MIGVIRMGFNPARNWGDFLGVAILSMCMISCASHPSRVCAYCPALNETIANHETAEALKLIDSGHDISEVDMLGRSPLDWAASNGDVEVLKALHLRSLKSKVTLRFDKAMYWAMVAKNSEAALWILDHGGNINADLEGGDTYLTAAADREMLDLVVGLVERGAGIHKRDHAGYTPLMKSAQYRDVRITKFLLSKGASVTDSARGHSVLSLAVDFQHVETVRLLIAHGADTGTVSDAGETLLMRAAKTPSVEMIEYLLGQSLQLNAKDKSGQNALFYALENDRIIVVKTLMDRGVAIDVYSNDGTTPALLAAMHGYMDLTSDLVRRGNAYVLSSSTPDRAFASAHVARVFAEKFRVENKLDSSLGAYHDANELLTKLMRFYEQAELQSQRSKSGDAVMMMAWAAPMIVVAAPVVLGVVIGQALLKKTAPARVEVEVHRNLLPRSRELVEKLSKRTSETMACLSKASTQKEINACPI